MQSISLVPVLKNYQYLLDKYKLLLWIILFVFETLTTPTQKLQTHHLLAPSSFFCQDYVPFATPVSATIEQLHI